VPIYVVWSCSCWRRHALPNMSFLHSLLKEVLKLLCWLFLEKTVIVLWKVHCKYVTWIFLPMPSASVGVALQVRQPWCTASAFSVDEDEPSFKMMTWPHCVPRTNEWQSTERTIDKASIIYHSICSILC